VGQLLAEVHLSGGKARGKTSPDQQVDLLKTIFNNIEAHGLRLFHKEINARWDMGCVELAFVQAGWTPQGKNYTSTQT
jgi:hypothetical protein